MIRKREFGKSKRNTLLLTPLLKRHRPAAGPVLQEFGKFSRVLRGGCHVCTQASQCGDDAANRRRPAPPGGADKDGLDAYAKAAASEEATANGLYNKGRPRRQPLHDANLHLRLKLQLPPLEGKPQNLDQIFSPFNSSNNVAKA